MNEDIMKKIINRIKNKRLELNYSFQDLANLTNMSKSTLQRYESGGIKNIPLDKLEILSDALHVTPEWIMCLENDSTMMKHSKFISIPVLGRVAAGVPVEAMEDILGYEDISIEEAKGGNFFALQIKGDSMEPKFSEGDVVIVRQQPTVESGDIAVVMVNGSDATVKRLILHEECGLSLIALNPAYSPKYYTDNEVQSLPVSVLGKVVELRAKF
ncbi:MAG: XRE family transcriptional regulator [Anaerovoracaceae bacterium]